MCPSHRCRSRGITSPGWLSRRSIARRGLGERLLTAAENYLYYCPAYFAAQTTPFYGIIEKLWVPWYGSTERMGVSATHDKELVEWLSRRGYQVIHPGDVSLVADLHGRERPARSRPGQAQPARGADQ